jgi:hypothetical protein
MDNAQARMARGITWDRSGRSIKRRLAPSGVVRPPKKRGRPLKEKLANKPTQLYRFYDDSSALLYVGISLSIAARLAGHKCQGWYLEIKNITVEVFPARQEAKEAEDAAIKAENPKYNIVGRDSAPVVTSDEWTARELIAYTLTTAERHRNQWWHEEMQKLLSMRPSEIVKGHRGLRKPMWIRKMGRV